MSQASETLTTEPPRTGDTILEVRNTSVVFQMGRGEATVLNDMNVEIFRGEVFGIAGESGCGKSMFADAILDGVDDPGVIHGEIMYHPQDGDPVDILDLSKGDLNRVRWEEIAMVFQGAMDSFNPTIPIRAHFKETLQAHNQDTTEGMERAEDLLREVNLDPDRILDPSTYQHELSGGQKQRVLIALSLLLDPEILVLDEPTAALDLKMQRSVLRLLHRIKDEFDLTVVIISHDLPVIAGFADRMGVMYAFEIVELGETLEVMYDAAHPYTRSLLRATPDLKTPVEDIQTLPGTGPDPVNIPSGCPFHPRCPVADDRCEIEKPELVSEADSNHRSACFYVGRSRDQIPSTLTREEEP